MTNMCYMQLLLLVSAVVTMEIGSWLSISCQSLATVLSPLNWQHFQFGFY